MNYKYYVRVKSEDISRFEQYIADNGIAADYLSNDFGSSMYAVTMTSEEALSLRLVFPLLGCLNFQKTMAKSKAD